MARITIIGPQGSRERKLLKHNSLGRHPTNTHQVLDRVVSKEHCHIDLVDGHYVLKDLGSLNGTYLNGEKVAESVLEDGDEITMGSTQIVFDGIRQLHFRYRNVLVLRCFEDKPYTEIAEIMNCSRTSR